MGPNTRDIQPELGQAMIQALEASFYLQSEGVDDITLGRITDATEQIQQILETVDLDVAKVLIQEIEQVAFKLEYSFTAEEQQAVINAVFSSLGMLNKYLYCIHNNQQCSPLALVNGINQLRAFLKKPLIAEYDFFHPSMQFGVTYEGHDQHNANACLQDHSLEDGNVDRLKQLHADFRQALLGWVTNKKEQSLNGFSDAIRLLGEMSSLSSTRKLWWVAEVYIDSLKQMAENSDTSSSNYVFAELDKVIGNMIKQPDLAPSDELIEKRMREMLFSIGYVSHCVPLSDDNKIRQLDKILGLSQWFNYDLGAVGLFAVNHEKLFPHVSEKTNADMEVSLTRTGDDAEEPITATEKNAPDDEITQAAATTEETNACGLTKNIIPFPVEKNLHETSNVNGSVNFSIQGNDDLDQYMNDIQSNLSKWSMESVDENVLTNLQASFHALHAYAEKTGDADVAELSKISERLLVNMEKYDEESIDDARQNEALLNLLNEVYDSFFDYLYLSKDDDAKHISSLKKMMLLLDEA